MLIGASWSDELKELLGLSQVRQVWKYAPTWYFRIAEVPGVYRLQLEDTSLPEDSPGHGVRGMFSLSFYPSWGDGLASRFSFEERALIKSRFFDPDGTPTFERMDEIPPGLFVVGALDWKMDPDDRWALFTLESLSSMRVRYEAERLEESSLLTESRLYREGEIAREVPGWDLSRHLFDRLISLWAYHCRTKPQHVAFTGSQGFEHVYLGPSQGPECMPADDIYLYSLHVAFAHEGCEGDTDRALSEELSRSNQQILFSRSFDCGCPHHFSGETPPQVRLNPLWWTLSDRHFSSNLASTCGCE
ncbi:MAG: hypothetical protein AB1733_12355 [Thermodesulfobacteriota bacterium]